jgi:hypothetical protein
MGAFLVEVLLAAPTRLERREVVERLVDRWSTYTWVGATRLRALSIGGREVGLGWVRTGGAGDGRTARGPRGYAARRSVPVS